MRLHSYRLGDLPLNSEVRQKWRIGIGADGYWQSAVRISSHFGKHR
jgi:hypothetical protein